MNDRIPAPDADHYLLLNLLGEYAGKLRRICDGYYRRKNLFMLISSFFAIIPFLFVLFLLIGLLPSREHMFPNPESFIVFLSLFFGSSIVISSTIAVYSQIIRSKHEIHPLKHAVEKLVTRASQLEDHSIQDLDEKTVFDLRLAEGESALEYADWVLRSGLLPRFSKPSDDNDRHYRTRSHSL